MNLTPQKISEINRTIAEVCGWKLNPNPHSSSCLDWVHPNGTDTAYIHPNYYGDLNACHEMESALSRHQLAKYGACLQAIANTAVVGFVPGDYHDMMRSLARCCGADAKIRCQSFICAVFNADKWEELTK